MKFPTTDDTIYYYAIAITLAPLKLPRSIAHLTTPVIQHAPQRTVLAIATARFFNRWQH